MPAGEKDEKESTAILVETDKADDKKKNKKNSKDDKPKPDELSEEDQALKEGLELAVTLANHLTAKVRDFPEGSGKLLEPK
eukprot:gene27069-33739_t